MFTSDSREQWGPPLMVSKLRFRNRLLAGFAGARNYVVLRCCSRKGERWKAKVKAKVERMESEGEMSNDKAQMPNG